MSAQDTFARDDRGGDGKGQRRERAIALVGAAVALGLLITLLVTRGWFSLDAQPSSGSMGAGDAATPTASTAPTSPPIGFPTFSLPWPTYMGGSDRSGYSTGGIALTPATVGGLKLQWKLRARGAIFSQPVVANGLIYWGSWDGYEHATSAATGKDVWSRYLGQTVDTSGQCNPSAAGISSTATVAFAPIQGRRTPLVFVGGGNAVFYALNAQTGSVVWQDRLGPSPSTYIWSSPGYYAGSIYIGTASFGDCPLVQGRIFQLSVANGKVERVFNVVPDGCTGGSVWGSVTIDPTTGMLYAGTGNPGDCGVFEPYAIAVIALRASDLAVVGSWQVPASQQIIDGDFGYTPTLFTARIGGVTRRMVGIGNKSGMYYAFDTAHVSNGPMWSLRVGDVGLCAECGDGSYVPGAWDGTSLYVPSGKTTINGAACAAGLRALNPASGSVIWGRCLPGPAYGALTAAPGLLVMGASPFVMVIGTQKASAGRALFTFRDPSAPNPWFYGSASIADSEIFIGDSDGNLYALGL
jgi:outer membrane protein assembly factor BamB